MNNKFLMMVGTICGGVVILSLLILPMMVDDNSSDRVISLPTGGFVLMFGWLAGGFAAMLFFGMNNRINVGDDACRTGSLIGFKLLAFFLIAMLLEGSRHMSWGIGFWLAFLASIVGSFAVYLTFNPKLAAKIAEAAKSDDAPAADKPAADAPDAPADE